MALLSKAKIKVRGKISDVAFPNVITIHTILNKFIEPGKVFGLEWRCKFREQ
jgi:hypothetical protein